MDTRTAATTAGAAATAAPEPAPDTQGLPHTDYGAHTWLELRELARRDDLVVVIPTATLEDHGYHLPIDTDGHGSNAPLVDLAARLINVEHRGAVAMASTRYSYMPHWSGLSRSGVMGDPTVATAEKGRVLVERARREAADFIAEAASRPRAPGADRHHDNPRSEPWPER